MRTILISMSVALGLIGIILLLAYIFQFQLPDEMNPAAQRSRKRGMICTREKELVQIPRKICIYLCEDGSKTRIEGVDKCLKEIEI